MDTCTLIVRPFIAHPHMYVFVTGNGKLSVGRAEAEATMALFSTAAVCGVFHFKVLSVQHPHISHKL